MLCRDHHRLRLDEREIENVIHNVTFAIRILTGGGRNSRICPWGEQRFRPLRPSSADVYLKAWYRSRRFVVQK